MSAKSGVAIVLTSASIVFGVEQQGWPPIAPVTAGRYYRDTTKDTPFRQLIKRAGGAEPLYKLECHNGNYGDQSEINFSGDFQCALFSLTGGKVSSWNLLVPDEPWAKKSDWMNRGRMLGQQSYGNCANYAEYGSVRHFRLRGMRVTLRFDRLRWIGTGTQARLGGFNFGVRVEPDPAATGSVAEPVHAPTPPQNCLPPIPRKE